MPPGTEVTTAQWAECMGEPPANVRHYFEQLEESGLVSMRQKGSHARAPMFWTINAAAQCKPAASSSAQRESAVAAAPITTAANRCKKCGGVMKPGIAMQSTTDCSTEGTCSPGGPGRLITCLKCSACGWSVDDKIALIDGEPTCRWPKCKCMSVCDSDGREVAVESPAHPTGLRLSLRLEIEREGQSHLLTLEEAHQLTKDGEAVGEFLRRHLREAV